MKSQAALRKVSGVSDRGRFLRVRDGFFHDPFAFPPSVVFYKREPLPELPEPLELLPKLHQVLCKLPINFGILRFFDRGGDETCQNHSRYRDPLKDNL